MFDVKSRGRLMLESKISDLMEEKLGGRLVTLVIEGDVSAVKQAIEAGSTKAIKKPVSVGVLANPHPEIQRIVAISASRFKEKESSGILDDHKMLGQDPPDFNIKEQMKQ